MAKETTPSSVKSTSGDKSSTNADEETVVVKKDPDLVTLDDIKEHAKQIEKGVHLKEGRFISRVLRALVTTRKKLNNTVLYWTVHNLFPANSESRPIILKFIDEPMETGESVFKCSKQPSTILPEFDTYIHLLVLVHLIDTHKYPIAVKCSELLMEKVCSQSRRTLDAISAKCFFYHSRAYELIGQLSSVRSFFHARLRTATLRHNDEGAATLINLLLRDYLSSNLYEQADKLVAKSTFPKTAANNEWARYLYYLGRIKTLQLEYTEGKKNLYEAIRKAPQQTALGFRQTVYKLAVTVELLLGEIPDKLTFRQPGLRKSLEPYFQLTQAVRAGNLNRFNEVLDEFGDIFRADDTYTLIIRLRHNVIKTGIRMINLAYSKISLKDIANKLTLDSAEDAEFIVAKAIRDGVIEATIDHDQAYLQSKDNPDIYSTTEPQKAFHERIEFCLEIYNNSVKALRFPPKSYTEDIETAEERREREKQDLELAEMADDDDAFP